MLKPMSVFSNFQKMGGPHSNRCFSYTILKALDDLRVPAFFLDTPLMIASGKPWETRSAGADVC